MTLSGGAAVGAAAMALRHVLDARDVGAAMVSSSTPGQSATPTSAPSRTGLVVDPHGVLDLPRGFSYLVLSRAGDRMSDGLRTPALPDAMACFDTPQGWVLMRNHEVHLDAIAGALHLGQQPPAEAFDRRYHGGVTRLVLDPATLDVTGSNLVLTGTSRNCAGGVSPWGWLSCEESLDPGHGYVFLCDPSAESVQPPRRIDAYGRFNHEAATVTPGTAIAYLTEDQVDSSFYRFIPADPTDPFVGKLQALRVTGTARADLGPLEDVGRPLGIDWVDIGDAEGTQSSVRAQAQSAGAAVVRRGEGLWLDGDDVYFSATIGGPRACGQIFRLSPASSTLELTCVSRDPAHLNMPDNLCLAPDGSVFVAEDNLSGVQHIRRVDSRGTVTTFARNRLGARELAGVCFSPDGSTLFVNMQGDGLTLAIRGPFAA